MLTEIQNTIQVFANLAVASATALCFVIGIAGTFQQRIPLDCGNCRLTVQIAKAAPVLIRPVTLASVIR